MEFREPRIGDKEKIGRIMKESGYAGCEYTFGNLLMWSGAYDNKIDEYDGKLLARYEADVPMYMYPCGKGDCKKSVEALIEYSQEHDTEKLHMYGVTPDAIKEIEDAFPGKFRFEAKRDFFDYIYLTDDLINLSGKKYHAKRNHIAYFKKTFSWSFEEMNRSNLDECYAMNEKWEEMNREKNPEELDTEKNAIIKAFENFDELDLQGGLLRADGDIVAYTIGEEINSEFFCTHIEKAFSDVRGAYPAINQEFAKNLLSGYKYINREEDTGSEGLRKAKLSYYPAILLEKYNAVYEG